MAFLLRQIKKRRWDVEEDSQWLGNDIKGDALSDLNTRDNNLSV